MGMDYEHAITVNQKLGFARILIDAAQQFADNNEDAIPVRQTVQAFLDGAIAQLNIALVYFTLEICEIKLPADAVTENTLTHVLRVANQRNINNALLRELELLLKQLSWLRDFIECYHNPQYLTKLFSENNQKNNPSAQLQSEPAVLATDRNPSIGPIPAAPIPTITSWLINIQNLVERHRSQAVEE